MGQYRGVEPQADIVLFCPGQRSLPLGKTWPRMLVTFSVEPVARLEDEPRIEYPVPIECEASGCASSRYKGTWFVSDLKRSAVA